VLVISRERINEFFQPLFADSPAAWRAEGAQLEPATVRKCGTLGDPSDWRVRVNVVPASDFAARERARLAGFSNCHERYSQAGAQQETDRHRERGRHTAYPFDAPVAALDTVVVLYLGGAS
jgi:hypothetical protein